MGVESASKHSICLCGLHLDLSRDVHYSLKSQSKVDLWLYRNLQLYCLSLSAPLLCRTLDFVRNKLYDCILAFTDPEFLHNGLVRDIVLCESQVLFSYRNTYLK